MTSRAWAGDSSPARAAAEVSPSPSSCLPVRRVSSAWRRELPLRRASHSAGQRSPRCFQLPLLATRAAANALSVAAVCSMAVASSTTASASATATDAGSNPAAKRPSASRSSANPSNMGSPYSGGVTLIIEP